MKMSVALVHLRPVLNSVSSYTQLSPLTVYRAAYEAMESRIEGTVGRVLHPGELIGDEDGIDIFMAKFAENLEYAALTMVAKRNGVDLETILDTETHDTIAEEICDIVGDMVETNKVMLTGL